MNKYILQSEDIRSTDWESLGGKAQGLKSLEDMGLKTPLWCVLPTFNSKKLLCAIEPEIQEILNAANSENKKLSVKRIKSLLEKHRPDLKTLQQELEIWIQKHRLHRKFFAVRSSYKGEDGQDCSFAGQFQTFLKVHRKDLAKKVWACIKASYSTNILTYKDANNLDLSDHAMSVIVQEMVFAERSGVCFSMNPNTYSESEIYISAAFGDCEGVVSGESDCDSYIVSKKTGAVTKTVPEKKIYFNCKEGRAPSKLPSELSKIAVLNSKNLSELRSYVKKIETFKKHPQDIEWAFDGELYFLQVRPVTYKKKQGHGSGEKIVFDNSNIQESYCGLTLPLTFSLASNCYRMAYNQLMKFMSFSEEQIKASDFRHSNMLSYVDGRVYYNINSWYEGLRFMPSFKKSKEDMESMMGVEEPIDFVESFELTRGEKLKKLPQIIKILFKLTYKFSRIDKIAQRFDREFWKTYSAYREKLKRDDLEPKDLLDLHRGVTEDFLKEWAAPLINDFYVMVYNGKVQDALKKIDRAEELSLLTSGEDLESIKPTLQIIEMASYISERQGEKSFQEIWQELNAKDHTFRSKVDTFFERYGDRSVGELKLETETFRVRPSKLEDLLKNYSENSGVKTKNLINSRLKEDTYKTIVQELRSREGRLAALRFKKNLKKLKKGIVYRESMRLHRARVIGLFRDIYRQISVHFEAFDVIQNREDIFYLTATEIENFICARSANKNLKSVVDLRKKEFEGYEKSEPQFHFEAAFPFTENFKYRSTEETSEEESFSGLGCYPGVVEGEVEVLMNADESVNLKDKILCTVRTDPGWAPLFPQVKGLLIEKGSSLSHSAVVAREMGIPTIVGVKDITKKLKSGDRITLDGKTGQVKKEERKESVSDEAHHRDFDRSFAEAEL